MSDRQPKPLQREAYPRLTSYDVLRGLRDDPELCQFFTEGGMHCGDAVFLLAGDGVLKIIYQFHRQYLEYPKGEELLRFEPAPNGVDSKRIFFRCSKCNGRVAKLVFDRFWACAKCHRLLYRYQLVAPGTARLERMVSLEQLLARGRPHRMRDTTYQRLMNELEELRSWDRLERVRVASELHSLRIDARWAPLSDVNMNELYPYVQDAVEADDASQL